MKQSPQDEGPPNAVPEASEEEDDDGIDVARALPARCIGKGEVEIVAEPVGKGDVPPTPEVSEVEGLVRAG